MLKLQKVNFKTEVLSVVDENQLIAVKDICEAIGINFVSQYEKLKADPTFQSKLIKVQTNGGIQEVFTIPLSKLNGWLFSINPNKVKPEVKEKLIEYKKECFDVLYKHFNSKKRVVNKFQTIARLEDRIQALASENERLKVQSIKSISSKEDFISIIEKGLKYDELQEKYIITDMKQGMFNIYAQEFINHIDNINERLVSMQKLKTNLENTLNNGIERCKQTGFKPISKQEQLTIRI